MRHLKQHATFATLVVGLELALAVTNALAGDWPFALMCVALAAAWALIHLKDLELGRHRRIIDRIQPAIELSVKVAQRNVTLLDEIKRLQAERKTGGAF